MIGRYTLHGEIASGGMATVHFGRLVGPSGFARTVAIKRLHPQFAKDPEFVAMFLDEARLAARLKHPNVVPTLDVINEGGELLLVMDYVHGESLSRVLRVLTTGKNAERPPLKVVSSVICALLHGLHAAHEAQDEHGASLGIVHRDVSPQNVLIGADGTTRVLDFGVAKAMGRSQVTRDGQLKGKFAYMAPEQLSRGGVDRRADIFASAIVLWEMLTLRRLFDGDSELAIMAQVTMKEVPAPSTLGIDLPPALEAVVMRGLAKNPDERFQTAREMAMALESAVPPASAWEVAEWLGTVAKDALARREREVKAIERASIVNAEMGSSPGRADGSVEAASLPSATGSQISGMAATGTTAPQGRSNALVVALALAAVLGLGLAAVLAFRSPPTNPAPTNASAAAAATATATAAAAATATATATATASATATATASASAPAAALPATTKSPSVTTTVKAAKATGCNPPYTIDAKGIRRMKPECL